MARFDLLRRPQPLIALLAVSSGWALSHQVGSDSVFAACSRFAGLAVVLVSLVGLAITVAGGLYGWRAWRGPGEGRRFFGLVSALLALLAGFAIVLQIAAGLILPRCFG
jgi:hypothetical protein